MRKVISAVMMIFCVQCLIAQDYDGYYSATFDFNQPLSNTSWNNTTSVFGLNAGYQHMLGEHFSIGGEVNWGTYKQYKPVETVQNQGGAITTDYFNYVYAYGLVVSGRYYLPTEGLIKPYGGLGLGAAYNKYTTFYNIYTDQVTSWGFLARPEAGVMIRFNERRSVGLTAGIHYDISTASQKQLGYYNFSNIGINVGIVVINW